MNSNLCYLYSCCCILIGMLRTLLRCCCCRYIYSTVMSCVITSSIVVACWLTPCVVGRACLYMVFCSFWALIVHDRYTDRWIFLYILHCRCMRPVDALCGLPCLLRRAPFCALPARRHGAYMAAHGM